MCKVKTTKKFKSYKKYVKWFKFFLWNLGWDISWKSAGCERSYPGLFNSIFIKDSVC